jgi:hypothetical protein
MGCSPRPMLARISGLCPGPNYYAYCTTDMRRAHIAVPVREVTPSFPARRGLVSTTFCIPTVRRANPLVVPTRRAAGPPAWVLLILEQRSPETRTHDSFFFLSKLSCAQHSENLRMSKVEHWKYDPAGYEHTHAHSTLQIPLKN